VDRELLETILLLKANDSPLVLCWTLSRKQWGRGFLSATALWWLLRSNSADAACS